MTPLDDNGYTADTRPNDLFGVFHEEKPVYVGEPFVKDAYKLSRHKVIACLAHAGTSQQPERHKVESWAKTEPRLTPVSAIKSERKHRLWFGISRCHHLLPYV
jgi:hypothetical protein